MCVYIYIYVCVCVWSYLDKYMSATTGPSNKNLWLRPAVMKRELRELVKQKEKKEKDK